MKSSEILKAGAGLSTFVLILLMGLSCSDSSTSVEDDIDLMISEVKAATKAYQDVNNAKNAGWNAVMSPCVEHPSMGGMGYHYGRMDFIDGRINHLEPQILLYQPLEGGNLEFIGVEYIIPFGILPASSAAPELMGQKFRQNHELEIWALHVWTEKENPAGMFSDFNPNVSCEFEVDVMIQEVRTVTESYQDVENANTAGWNNVISPCVEHPTEGGMGYHHGRMEFFDGRINHLEPQVLLYEPLENGGLEFIGVEYIIPFAVLPEDAQAPVLFGQMYHQNHELEIWALHVWTEKENPVGLFNDWNPNVSCQFAD